MSQSVTVRNVPCNIPEFVFKQVLKENKVGYTELLFPSEIPEGAETQEVHILLRDDTPMDKAIARLSDCEVSDQIIEPLETPADIYQELFHKHEEKRKKALHAKGVYPEEDKITPNSLDDPSQARIPFHTLNLSETSLKNLSNHNIEETTPIQALSIPYALQGHDIIGRAQTGTGKTLAFALPIVEKILAEPKKGIRALVISPTRELAIQIEEVFAQLIEGTEIKTFVMFGGEHILEQIVKLREGVDILVATPGRLLDLQNRRRVRFDMAEIFVMDEADRMMDMGFMPDVKTIHSCFYEHPQTMLFSATTPREFIREINYFLNDPVFVDVGAPDLSPLEAVTQELLEVNESDKPDKLYEILSQEDETTLVFCSTKKDTENLASRLASDGFPVKRVHGDIDQADRIAAVNAFRNGEIRILVATDVAARGLDIPNVEHVINYDLPQEPEDHIHRIGRTARAGASGKATTFITKKDKKNLRQFDLVLGQNK